MRSSRPRGEPPRSSAGAPAGTWLRWRPLAIWAGVLAVGIVLIALRYDRSFAGGETAEHATALSAYLFVIALPTCFYLSSWVLGNRRAAAALTAVVFLVTTLPYKLLGLDSIYYYGDDDHLYAIGEIEARLEFFPDGPLRAFPYDWLFMPLLFAAGAGIVWGIAKLRERGGLTVPRAIPVLLTIAFAAICVQAYVHTSMRAPYTYLAYFQRPAAEAHWYHGYHFEDGSGATQADQWVFTPLEDIFQGSEDAVGGNNQLLRRPFSFYLASQFSYFVNTFYVWLALNCLFWLAAVFAVGRLVWRWVNPRAGVIAAAFTVAGPGFVAFVGTPAMYLQSYAAIAIALCLFEDLVVRPGAADRRKLGVFAGALALAALVYDLTPFFAVLLAYGLARSSVRAGPLVATLVAGFALAAGFGFMAQTVLGIDIVQTNQAQLDRALNDLNDFLLHPGIPWYDALVEALAGWTRLFLQAFFVIPVVLAVIGLRWLRERPLQVLVAAFVLTNLALVAMFQIADENKLDHLPRLVYAIFPAVYLTAAIALERFARVREEGASIVPNRLRVAAPWIVLGAMFALANVDIFGYPSLYVEFFVSKPPVFTP